VIKEEISFLCTGERRKRGKEARSLKLRETIYILTLTDKKKGEKIFSYYH